MTQKDSINGLGPSGLIFPFLSDESTMGMTVCCESFTLANNELGTLMLLKLTQDAKTSEPSPNPLILVASFLGSEFLGISRKTLRREVTEIIVLLVDFFGPCAQGSQAASSKPFEWE